ncbi:unnamed protein product [Adineta steineri]|uniref:RUN and FYVE domain-containing protein 2 n=1 Tax=Adineta steineri TaxID=433720 RepID=A0A819F0C6_9BILA|nr:unnamed protein product [Adineta steineri]
MPTSTKNETRTLTSIFNSNDPNNSENLKIERENLLCVFKLVIKDLLNSSLKNERVLEKENFSLKHFFLVFEHILLHGYNGKKVFQISTAGNRKDLWPIIDLITRKTTDTNITDISTSIKEMTNIRTPLGRVRAWLRLALMQKHLADYFTILIEQKQELKELYDNEALLLSDDSMILTGLLVGLNVLDFNFCLKEMILDQPIETPIYYNLYLRERRIASISSKNTHPPGAIKDPIDDIDDYSPLPIIKSNAEDHEPTSVDDNNADNRRFSNMLDQKNYVEEINRKLQTTVNGLQERLQVFEQTNKILAEETAVQKTRIEQLEEQVVQITAEKEQILSSYHRKLETTVADIEVERETFQTSRNGFDLMYNELQKKYQEEQLTKEKIENAYQTQLSQNSEIMESTKIMEKNIEVKNTLYDHIKEDNNLLLQKLQIEKDRNDEKEHQIQTIEKEKQMLRQTINELETNIEKTNKEKQALSDTIDKLNQTLIKSDTDKTSLETDLRMEQDFQQRLNQALTNEKDKVSRLQFDIHELRVEYDSHKNEMEKKEKDFEKKYHEQEKTIEELALKLGASMTREDEFREKDTLRSLPWMKDEDVKECCQCKKEFNTIRRKHHCRSCGQIFCESCVSTKLTLASSNKPVRVCDSCCNRVLAQYAVRSP